MILVPLGCLSECDPGYYGSGCQFNCSGHCVDDEPCESVSGNCMNGCQSQFTGDRCIVGNNVFSKTICVGIANINASLHTGFH